MRPRSAAAANSDVHVSKWHRRGRHRRHHRRVEINNLALNMHSLHLCVFSPTVLVVSDLYLQSELPCESTKLHRYISAVPHDSSLYTVSQEHRATLL